MGGSALSGEERALPQGTPIRYGLAIVPGSVLIKPSLDPCIRTSPGPERPPYACGLSGPRGFSVDCPDSLGLERPPQGWPIEARRLPIGTRVGPGHEHQPKRLASMAGDPPEDPAPVQRQGIFEGRPEKASTCHSGSPVQRPAIPHLLRQFAGPLLPVSPHRVFTSLPRDSLRRVSVVERGLGVGPGTHLVTTVCHDSLVEAHPVQGLRPQSSAPPPLHGGPPCTPNRPRRSSAPYGLPSLTSWPRAP